MNTCKTCKGQKPRRFFLCNTCWKKIPVEVRMDIRHGTEKGNHTLRAFPSKGWLGEAMKYVGIIKVPYILGAGISAVKIAEDRSEV